MKVRTNIIATVFLAGVVAAQTAPASQTVQQNPPQAQTKKDSGHKPPAKNPFKPKTSKPAAAQTAKTPQRTAAQAGKTSQPAAAQAKTQQAKAAPAPAQKTGKKEVSKQPAKQAPAKPTPPVQAKGAPKQEAPKPADAKAVPAPETAQSELRKLPSPGKRDPFVSPLAAAAMRGPGAGSTTGKRCLVVDQLVLKGIVQMKTGNFALVENISRRPYVLHENDSLFNGSVVRITGDSVVFREQSNDILGRPVSKEVVKKVSAPSV